MSSPIDRSSDQDEALHYAPKWARDLERAANIARRLGARDDAKANTAPADNPNFESEGFRRPPALEPSPGPDPPMQEPWGLDSGRFLADGDFGALLRFFFVGVLAALSALAIVAILPTIQTFDAKRQPAGQLVAPRSSNKSSTPARSAATATESRYSSMGRSYKPPSSEEQRIAPIDPAAPAPAAPPLPARPMQPIVATPAPTNPTSATSLYGNPALAGVAPPANDAVPRPAPASVTSVKTVPVPSKKRVRPLGPNEIQTLLKQGEDFVSVGDFASARIVFGRVAEAGDARGALKYAATYDPIVLAKSSVEGATPDVAKARESYAKARDLGSRDAVPRLKALAASGAFEGRDPTIRASAAMATAKEASDKEISPAPATSYWKHGRSIMRLEAVGTSRKFLFYKPSDAQLKAGAKPGSLRFDGQIIRNGYTGTAFLYSSRCGRSAFQVSGVIENNDERVILSGTTPQMDSACQKIKITHKTLIFNFQSQLAQEGAD